MDNESAKIEEFDVFLNFKTSIFDKNDLVKYEKNVKLHADEKDGRMFISVGDFAFELIENPNIGEVHLYREKGSDDCELVGRTSNFFDCVRVENKDAKK